VLGPRPPTVGAAVRADRARSSPGNPGRPSTRRTDVMRFAAGKLLHQRQSPTGRGRRAAAVRRCPGPAGPTTKAGSIFNLTRWVNARTIQGDVRCRPTDLPDTRHMGMTRRLNLTNVVPRSCGRTNPPLLGVGHGGAPTPMVCRPGRGQRQANSTESGSDTPSARLCSARSRSRRTSGSPSMNTWAVARRSSSSSADRADDRPRPRPG